MNNIYFFMRSCIDGFSKTNSSSSHIVVDIMTSVEYVSQN